MRHTRLSLLFVSALAAAAAGRHLRDPLQGGGGPEPAELDGGDLFPIPLEEEQDPLPDEGPYPEERNPSTDADGRLLVESDMLLEEGTDRKMLMSRLWPRDRPVPFVLTPEMEPYRAAVEAGLSHWENVTCVNFREEPAGFHDEPHLRFIRGTGCFSFLGMIQKPTGQSVSIGAGCGRLVTVAHEIGHSLGFFHEQSRTDRDEYIIVNWDNIPQGRWPNFNKKPKADALGVEYDLRSVMHYSSYAFSRDYTEPTLVSKDPLLQHLVGNRMGGLTHRDRALANAAYGCAEHCTAPPTCLNEGYVDKHCQCACPPGVSGEQCETAPADYRYYGPTCGDPDVTAPGTITSVGYPASAPTDNDCYWLVTAPAGQAVNVTFTDVSMNLWSRCKKDRLTVMLSGELLEPAAVGCGDQFVGRSFVSDGNRLLVKFRTRGRSRVPRFFSADVLFQPAV